MKQKGLAAPAESPGLVAASSPEQRRKPAQKRAGSIRKTRHGQSPIKAGLDGFSADPLGIGTKPPLHRLFGGPADDGVSLSIREKTHSPPVEADTVLTVTGKSKGAPESRLQPQQQTPFTGGEHTLPYMNKDQNAELSLEYKINPKASTRLVINPQDPNSPLYRPAEQDKVLNSGGLYMNMEVSENMQVKVGGEYCEIDDHGNYGSLPRANQGVAVGVEWNF